METFNDKSIDLLISEYSGLVDSGECYFYCFEVE